MSRNGIELGSYRAGVCIALLKVPRDQWLESDQIIKIVNDCWIIRNNSKFKKELSRPNLTKLDHSIWSILQEYADTNRISYRKGNDGTENGLYKIPSNVDFTTKITLNMD